ncbi:uncharacterized protein B0J16DRAFT_400320 [Fusarium flagelliforme]|uniref:uncharacterized protein n=1 Tax=Fusarium flagelliforme TaxID=2675880 RepID=UPI001E8CBA51|nr:uncharacterized protein B0J16DRAFT_400320 [Fusarium flagelliforme]KAH7186252.1 hypothetical protein B0J16DRAFT_400320 [Fusarium flagelliforme]
MVISDNQVSAPILQKLPNELIQDVLDLLPNRDIKSLRLTCRQLCNQAHLRFDRVFISANPLNVNVFLAVTNHNVFRQQVKEIIWDDATLMPLPSDDHDSNYGYSSDENEIFDNDDYENDGKISSWFVGQCKEELSKARSRLRRRGRDSKQQEQFDNMMPSREALSYYTRLVQQQENIIKSGADEEALRYALQESRFPHLTKVTVTPAAHGFLFFLLYETPMIRSFPFGFLYPIPRGWQCANDVDQPGDAEPWEDEDEKYKWRGFCLVSRLFADPKVSHNVCEISFDNHKILTGINHFVFDEPNEDYDHLCQVLARPGFKQGIRGLLANESDLEEIQFQTDYPVGHTHWAAPTTDFVSLFEFFPIKEWSSANRLKHFGFSGMQVAQDELISFLGKLPPTLRSIELSFLSVIKGRGNYAGILAEIRDKLGWRNHTVDQQIKIRLLVKLNQRVTGCYISVDKEVNDYIYGDGPPPFGVNGAGTSWAMLNNGTGMQYDEFDPDFIRPY